MEVKLFASVLFCALTAVASVTRDYEYYQYDDHYSIHKGSSDRSKRYVDHVISRLADTSLEQRASLHDKSSSENGGGGGGDNHGDEVEMIGNVAVVHHVEPTSSSPSPTHPPDLSVEPEKPVKDSSGKKAAPVEKKTITKAVTGYEGYRRQSTTPAAPVYMKSSTEDVEPSADDFPQDITNNTLEKHNLTAKQEDTFIYYNTTFLVDPKIAQQYWVDFEKEKNVIISEILSNSHRRAATVQLKFDFPFYGHMVQKVTIATGGFLYTGDYIHSWLAATQYIAPLMANFDTSLSPNSVIRYRDNGTALTVEWQRVMLQDRQPADEFTFQATLHSTGHIVFVYKTVPIEITNIEDKHHPCKVGLSDAYIIDNRIFFMRRKTIYEYHRVNFNKEEIKNWTVIILSPLSTCLDNKDCNSCLTSKIKIQCLWCESVKRCSNGFDRKRQEWQNMACDKSAVSDVGMCGRVTPSMRSQFHMPQVAVRHDLSGGMITAGRESATEMGRTETSSATTSMLGATVVIVLIACAALWVLYAYRNPHTPSGQVLIKYRPSQWNQWRRGEARYTAASIHM